MLVSAKQTRFKQLQNLHGPLTAALSSAREAFVLLDIFCHGWCYFYTLPMKPLFTNVTADPELTHTVISPTGPAKCFPLIVFIFLVNMSIWFQVAFRLPITWSLQRTVGVITFQNRKRKSRKYPRESNCYTLVPVIDLLPLCIPALSFIGFHAVTVSHTVGRSFIRLNRRFLSKSHVLRLMLPSRRLIQQVLWVGSK